MRRARSQTSRAIVEAVACPSCGAEKGAPCVRPQTNIPVRAARLQPLRTVHDQRRSAWEATS